jgi:hypothetical protein
LARRRGGLQRMIDRADGYPKRFLEQIALKGYESLRAAAKVAKVEPHTLGRWCGTERTHRTARPMAKAFWPAIDLLGIPRKLFSGWVLPTKGVCQHCTRPLSDASWYYQKRTRPETLAHRGCRKKYHEGYIPARCIGSGCGLVKWYTPSAYKNLKWTATIAGTGEHVRRCGRCYGKKSMEYLHRRFRGGIPVGQLAARRGRVA